jgi:yecA family protein
MIRATRTPPPIGWTPAQAEALRTALAAKSGADGPMGYAELAGFLFAVACAPDLVMPTEWIPEAMGEGPGAFGSLEEAQRAMNLVMALHNHINLQVLERRPALPAGIAPRKDPMENFGPDAPLGQWAQGYSQGQMWLEEKWDACLAAEPRADAARIDEALGAIMMALGFFASRGFAERCLREMRAPGKLENVARQMLDALPEVMRDLAELGRGLEDIRRARAPGPACRTRTPRRR